MNDVIELGSEALRLILVLVLPFVAVGAVIGGISSLLQEFTYLKDRGLTFAIKLIALLFTGYFISQFGLNHLLTFSEQIFSSI